MKINLYNSPIELGVRSLLLLRGAKSSLSLQQLIYLDYFLIHLGDLNHDEKSIHPSTPYRSGEIIVKRRIVQEAVSIMTSKEMITPELSSEGIKYSISEIGIGFLSLLNNDYYLDLEKSCTRLFSLGLPFDEASLSSIVKERISKWGVEFSSESLLKLGIDHD